MRGSLGPDGGVKFVVALYKRAFHRDLKPGPAKNQIDHDETTAGKDECRIMLNKPPEQIRDCLVVGSEYHVSEEGYDQI